MADTESDRRIEALEARVRRLEEQLLTRQTPQSPTASLLEGFHKLRAAESHGPLPDAAPMATTQPPPLPVTPIGPAKPAAELSRPAGSAPIAAAAPAKPAGPAKLPERYSLKPELRPAVGLPDQANAPHADAPQPARPVSLFEPRRPAPGFAAPIAPVNKPVQAAGKTLGFEFERALGLKWTGWIGAIVLVIGAALGVKFIYDQGWLQQMPPEVKLIMIAAAGVALLAAGEWVRRRIDRIPGASLMGAGVATLFLASYAGNAYYKLYDPGMALALTCLVTLIGAAVAWWGNLVSIAVLSIVGGSLIPLLVSNAHPQLAGFLSYLLMMQIVGLSLAYLGSTRRWWTLRGLTLGTTSFWMLAVMNDYRYADQTTTLLAFSAIFALAFQAELVATAFRRRIDQTPDWAPGVMLSDAGANFSTVVTGLLTAAVLWLLRDESTVTRTSAVLVTAAVCAALSAGIRRAAWPLAMGYAVQSAALLIVALPVALSGLWLVIGWAVLGIALATLGAVLDRQISRVAGIAAWMLAAFDALGNLNGIFAGSAHAAAWIAIFGQGITPALTVCWIVALMGQAIAWLTSTPAIDGRPERSWSWCMGAATVLLWATASMMMLPYLGATLSLVVLAWILVLADIGSDRIAWAVQGVAVLLLASVKWAVIDALAGRMSDTWVQQSPWFNTTMEMALVLAVSLPAMYWLRRASLRKALANAGQDYREASLIYAICCAVIALITVGLSLQVDLLVQSAVKSGQSLDWPADQYEWLLLTILWTAASTALWAAGKWVDRSSSIETRAQVAQWLTALLACKFLLLDTLIRRVDRPPVDVTVLFNAQALAGLGLVAAMTVQCWGAPLTFVRRASGFLSVLILLWIGTLEIDRSFEHAPSGQFTDPQRAKQVVISIFWSIFAIACVVGGFRARRASLRFFGLGLFGVTLLKVLLVDMSELGTGYKILSSMGLGLLLMGTSVLYGKLSPKLLGEQK
jgi:uncharacterized membrane protein